MAAAADGSGKAEEGAEAPPSPVGDGFLKRGPEEIVTRRLVLRRLTSDNGNAIYKEAFADAAHLADISHVVESIKTPALRQGYIDQQLVQWEDRTRYQYVVTCRADGRHVGMMCLFHPSHAPETCEVGYFVLSGQCRKGYGLEMLQGGVRVAFSQLGMHRVVLRISHRNAASQALARKAKFQLDGVLREDYQAADGQLNSTHLFSMLAHDDVARHLVAEGAVAGAAAGGAVDTTA